MILISSKGNIYGQDPSLENSPDYINDAISKGYNVEVSAWLIDDTWMLGDFPQYEVSLSFLERPEIWIRAMNLVGYVSLYNNSKAHVFWHHRDEYVFTSKGIKWANKGVITYDGVMTFPDEIICCSIKSGILEPLGVCSDNIGIFKIS